MLTVMTTPSRAARFEELLSTRARIGWGGSVTTVRPVAKPIYEFGGGLPDPASFPYDGMVEFEDPETNELVVVDASAYRRDYQSEIAAFRAMYKQECFQSGIDYVPLDTSMQFDKALLEYLLSRRARC